MAGPELAGPSLGQSELAEPSSGQIRYGTIAKSRGWSRSGFGLTQTVVTGVVRVGLVGLSSGRGWFGDSLQGFGQAPQPAVPGWLSRYDLGITGMVKVDMAVPELA